MSYTRVDSVCLFCGKDTSFEVDTADYEQFLQGADPKEVFHYLNDAEIEYLKTGICPVCYHNVLHIKDLVERHRQPLIKESIISISIAAAIITVLYLTGIFDGRYMEYLIGFVVGAAIEAHSWWQKYEKGLEPKEYEQEEVY